MFERFTRDARLVVKSAETHSRGLGSPTIEAEHLLLALASHEPSLPSLAEVGLNHDAVLEALDAVRERSLMAVGIAIGDFDVPPAPVAQRPRMAAPAKRALELSLREALALGHRRIDTSHVLLALLRAQAGTVPRALAEAGVDRDDLRARTLAVIDR
jgi:ATP-dependent Clp protease ATP-binding subunit ClpA